MKSDRNTPVTRLEIELAKEVEFHDETKRLLAHDLRSPAAALDLYITEARRKLDELKTNSGSTTTEQKLREYEFIIRDHLSQIISAGRRVVDMTRILDLSNLTPKEISQESEEFSPAYKIDEIFKVWAHDAVRKGKGLSLYYKNEDKSKKVVTNPGAFSSIFSNLLGNAIQYANKQSDIRAKLSLDQDLTFEIENPISSVIDARELNELLKRGYRRDKTKEDQLVRNEGFGLYFVNKVVRQGFLGDLKIRSDHKKRLDSATGNYEKAVYSSEYDQQLDSPLFYARVKLPLKIF